MPKDFDRPDEGPVKLRITIGCASPPLTSSPQAMLKMEMFTLMLSIRFS